MCTINFLLYGMSGVVIHMDTLALEIWGGYRVFLPETGMGIKPLTADECKRFVFAEQTGVGGAKQTVTEQLKLIA